MPRLSRTLRGYKKERNQSYKKQPLSMSHMRAFVKHTDGRDHNSRLVAAVLQVGYCSLARVSEYAVKTQKPSDLRSARTLRMCSVRFYPTIAAPHTIVINLSGSKTNQFGARENLVLRCSCDAGICGFCAFRKYLSQRHNITNGSFVFEWSAGKVLSKTHVRTSSNGCVVWKTWMNHNTQLICHRATSW